MMKNSTLLMPLLFIIALTGGCASTPKFDTTGVDLSVTPQQAANATETYEGKRFLWGGMIINSANLKEETQLEVLAYPLSSNQKPDLTQNTLGRFLAIHNGYLETTNFTEGRMVTVSGILQKNRVGRVGEMEYTYPTLSIDQLNLWPVPGQESESRFHFGLGVMLHN